jgi:pimeloyl-ACP methyl ester carboxylesterase
MVNIRFRFLPGLSFLVLLLCFSPLVFAQRRPQVDTAVTKLGSGFRAHKAKVSGTTLHYVRGGAGDAVMLVHGFPEDWTEFRHIMPQLARKFTVIAVDLRGVGGSQPATDGYDVATLAKDIHELAEQLQLKQMYLVGHDVGGIVAYAYARLYPQDLRGVMILDVPLVGIEPWDALKADPMLWHIGFHQTPKVPEALISGRELVSFREASYNRWTKNPAAISEEAARHYARSYATPAQLRAGLGFYRAFPEAEKFNQSHSEPLNVPMVLAGGDSAFGTLNPRIAEALKTLGCAHVTVETINNSAHYVADEQPAQVTALIERYAAK